MHFYKMHGIGNDYVYVDLAQERVEDPAALAIAVSRPHFGIGADGLVLIGPSDKADFSMRIFNADGSEGEMCGNATRCVALYLYERGKTDKTVITLETRAGIRTLYIQAEGGRVRSVRVDMGEPALEAAAIPTTLRASGRVIRVPVTVLDRTFEVTCVSTGNPHAVIFLEEDVENFPLEKYGPALERHSAFPARANIEFANVLARDRIRMRVWERGSNETMACGTGACATLTAAVLCGLCDRRATVVLNGGELEIEWDEPTNKLWKTGPAQMVFEGEWLL